MVSVKEIEVMEKEQTNLFCLILADQVVKFVLTLERKTLKNLPQKRYLRQF